jgi:hypothetical protein
MNNIFRNNWSEYGLGAIHAEKSWGIIVNNLFYDNAVYGKCAGIRCCDSSNLAITNNTFFGGTSTIHQEGTDVGVLCDSMSFATITNCIFWHTGSLDFRNCDVSYSCIDKKISGPGNIVMYPEFTDTLAGEFSLLGRSNCINSGVDYVCGLFLPSVDILGNRRIFNQRIDIGAYEYQEKPIGAFEDKRKTTNLKKDTAEMASHNDYSVFSNGSLTFRFDEFTDKPVLIKIFNCNGTELFSGTFQTKSDPVIHVANYSRGMYVVQTVIGQKVMNHLISLK